MNRLARLMLSMGIPTLVAQMINLLVQYRRPGVYRAGRRKRGSDRTWTDTSGDHDYFRIQFPCGSRRVRRLRRSHLDRAMKKGRADPWQCFYNAVRFYDWCHGCILCGRKTIFVSGRSKRCDLPVRKCISEDLPDRHIFCTDRTRTESVYYSTGAVEDGNGIGAHRSRV